MAQEVKQLSPEEYPGGKGGKKVERQLLLEQLQLLQ